MKIMFEFEKDTKNTTRFKEISDTPVVGSIYIQKSALKELGYTQNDIITVEIKKEEQK